MTTPNPQKLSVMIAEDNEIDRRVLQEHCERFGWSAKAVASGGELLAEMTLAKERKSLPDCLLVDWYMPHLDGVTAIGQLLKLIPPTQMPAVVFITALDEMMVEAAREEIGDNLVLHKPIDPAELRAVVESSIVTPNAAVAVSATAGELAPSTDDDGWPSLRGIDIDSASTNVGGDLEFYQELCETFVPSTREALARIEPLIAADDREALRQEVHKLRGQLGTLGALEHQAKAGDIEAAVIEGFTYQVDLEALLVFVRALIDDMDRWIASTR